jgi:hypothetical protein
VLAVVAGGLLVVAGAVAGLVPGPGGIVLGALGLGLIASEVGPAARALDWSELRLRSIGRKLGRLWMGTHPATRVALCLLGVAAVAGSGYLGYTWFAR